MTYVRAFLRKPDDGFSPEEKDVRKVLEEFLKNVEDQKRENSDTDYFSQVRFYANTRWRSKILVTKKKRTYNTAVTKVYTVK